MDRKEYTLQQYIGMLDKENLLVGILTVGEYEIEWNKVIKDVSYNSKEIKKDGIFICKGANFKYEYLLDAIKNGIAAFICDIEHSKDTAIRAASDSIPMIVVSDIRKAISKLSAMYFNYSWKDLKIIGITGTKGKSTTACMIKAILDKYQGREIGFSSGIYTYDGIEHVKSKKLTTPETIELHRILDNATKSGCNYLTMEVSSQGLKYDRVLDLDYEIGCFLNISKDHISAAEHSDMDDYLTSKLKLFKKAKIGLVNIDMDPTYVDRIREEAEKYCKKVIYINEPAIVEGPGYIDIETYLNGKTEKFRVNIGGVYNGINAVCAINVCNELGVPIDIMRDALETVVVPGRMEHYVIKDGVDVIVDCAHNKMSYEGLFRYANVQYQGRKKYFLFGCVGDKAYNRRKEAAKILDKYADFAVITERDPGKEPVLDICNEIYNYVENKDKARIVTDRDEAVKTILDDAVKAGNSIVLLCGCGSDAYVKRGNKLIEFDTDGDRVKEYIEKNKN